MLEKLLQQLIKTFLFTKLTKKTQTIQSHFDCYLRCYVITSLRKTVVSSTKLPNNRAIKKF